MKRNGDEIENPGIYPEETEEQKPKNHIKDLIEHLVLEECLYHVNEEEREDFRADVSKKIEDAFGDTSTLAPVLKIANETYARMKQRKEEKAMEEFKTRTAEMLLEKFPKLAALSPVVDLDIKGVLRLSEHTDSCYLDCSYNEMHRVHGDPLYIETFTLKDKVTGTLIYRHKAQCIGVKEEHDARRYLAHGSKKGYYLGVEAFNWKDFMPKDPTLVASAFYGDLIEYIVAVYPEYYEMIANGWDDSDDANHVISRMRIGMYAFMQTEEDKEKRAAQGKPEPEEKEDGHDVAVQINGAKQDVIERVLPPPEPEASDAPTTDEDHTHCDKCHGLYDKSATWATYECLMCSKCEKYFCQDCSFGCNCCDGIFCKKCMETGAAHDLDDWCIECAENQTEKMGK